MVKVGNGNRLGDLEEVQEEMVEPELMVGCCCWSRWEQLSCELGGCLCKTESSAHWCLFYTRTIGSKGVKKVKTK